jgi:hypothetical protein
VNTMSMVRMTITDWDGNRAAGVLLAVSGVEMRVAVRGCPDALRLSLHGTQWLDEEQNPVQIDYVPDACKAPEDGAWWLEPSADQRSVSGFGENSGWLN